MPEMPPIYIIPGMPRLRLPDFSVIISPVEPKRRGIPWIIAALIKEKIVETIIYPPCAFCAALSGS